VTRSFSVPAFSFVLIDHRSKLCSRVGLPLLTESQPSTVFGMSGGTYGTDAQRHAIRYSLNEKMRKLASKNIVDTLNAGRDQCEPNDVKQHICRFAVVKAFTYQGSRQHRKRSTFARTRISSAQGFGRVKWNQGREDSLGGKRMQKRKCVDHSTVPVVLRFGPNQGSSTTVDSILILLWQPNSNKC